MTTADAKPRPRDLFAVYHLGLHPDGSHRFANVADIARLYATDTATVSAWLKEAAIDPDTVGSVEFNLSALHVDAMFLDRDAQAAFIDQAWQGYREALKTAVPGRFLHDHDYDDL